MSIRVQVMTAEEAASSIPDGAVITVSSSSGLACPDTILKAIGDRFRATGHPRAITAIHPIAAGDMYGIKGVDHIAQKGLLKRIIAGSYPSGPSSMPSPIIWKMILDNEVEAYNVPSGLLYDMHREVAAKRPGVITKVGLDTFVDPRRQGCKMNRATTEELVRVVEFNGEEWLHLKNVPPDVAIIRATTADEYGNLSTEHEGAYLGAIEQALAARNNGGTVIAQVKRIVAAGSIPTQRVHVPSSLVDCIVVDPLQRQTTQTDYDAAISGEVRRPWSDFRSAAWSTDMVIAGRAAQELHDGDVVNLGFGIAANVPQILIDEGKPDAVNWVIEQGAVGGVPLTGFAFGCSANAHAFLPAPQQFTYFQGGGFDCSLLSFMEVDQAGNVNVSRLSAKPHVTAGCGGFVDITSHAKKLIFVGYFMAGGLELNVGGGRLEIIRDGKYSKFVNNVEHVTFSGTVGRTRGQDVTYITERCVIKLQSDGLTVTEIAPGIDLKKHVLDRSSFPLKVSNDLKLMDARLFMGART